MGTTTSASLHPEPVVSMHANMMLILFLRCVFRVLCQSFYVRLSILSILEYFGENSVIQSSEYFRIEL